MNDTEFSRQPASIADIVADTEARSFNRRHHLDSYYKEIIARGAEAATGPKDQPYGIREFSVQDINGVGIVFGQDIGHV